MQRIHNGNFILSGITKSFVNLPSDSGNIYLLEIDTSGSVIWSKSIGTDNTDIAYSIKETTDNGFIIAGETDSAGHINAYLVKTDSLINIQWSQIYSDSAYDVNSIRGVVQTSDGGYAFTGFSTLTTGPVNNNMFIVKTDSAGSVIISTHYFFTDSANYSQRGVFGYDIIQNSSGHLVVVGGVGGYYITAFSNIYMWLLIEADTSGAIVYSKAFSLNTGDCRALSIQQTPDDGYILGGYMGNYYLAMIKASPSIITQWCYHYDLSFNPVAKGYCARNTSFGGFILSGSLLSGTAMRIVKTDSNGMSGCAQSVPIGPGGASGNISLPSLQLQWTSVNNADTVSALTISSSINISTSTICSTVDIEELTEFGHFKIYPNPTHNTFTISFNNPLATANCQLSIYDVTGRVVHEQKINSQLSTVNCQLSAGIYFVKVSDGEKEYEEKLVVE
jgi:hypothetical protein